jgi:hypothetical protein
MVLYSNVILAAARSYLSAFNCTIVLVFNLVHKSFFRVSQHDQKLLTSAVRFTNVEAILASYFFCYKWAGSVLKKKTYHFKIYLHHTMLEYQFLSTQIVQ